MMFKNNSSKRLLIRYLVLAPLTIGLFMVFSFRMIPLVSNDIEEVIIDQEGDTDNVPSLFPLKVNPEDYKVTSGFGMRKDPFTNEEKRHFGIDLRASKGTVVVASADGIVEKVGYQPNGYGHFVLIKHGSTYKTRYAQMEESSVKEGDKVSKGQQVGLVGSSGRSTGPHLHFEVRKNDKLVDPADYIGERLK